MNNGTIKIFSFLLLAVSCSSFAANSDLVNQCSAVINMPETQFNSQAAAFSSLLDNCTLNNICSQIDSIDNCAGILASRDFYSNYLALAPVDNPPRFGGMGPTPIPFNQQPISNLNSRYNSSTPVYSNPTTNNNNNSNTTTNKDIHWF